MHTNTLFSVHKGISHHFEVSKYINELDHDQIRTLGGALGLEFPKLSRMNTPLSDVVAAWLRREDNVKEPPTWKNLVKALRSIGQNGIANRIEQDK